MDAVEMSIDDDDDDDDNINRFQLGLNCNVMATI